MDEVESLRGRVRRGPWSEGDLNDVFAQRAAIQTIPGGVAQDLGEPPEYTRFIGSGIRNGDFLALPPDPTGTINDITNKLPDWSLVTVQGTSITAAAVADASAASGYVIRFTCAGGNANDEICLEQIVPIVSNRKGAWAAWINAYFLAASASTASLQTKVVGQYLKADGSTATGTASTITTNFSASATEPTAVPGVRGTIPGDASLLRIRIGILRTLTGSTTGYIDLCDTFLNSGTDAVLVPDDTDPTLNPGTITKRNDVMTITPDDTGQVELTLDKVNGVSYFSGSPYGVRANRTSNQSIANASDTSINFNATDSWDAEAMHDTVTANARITFERAGYWMVGGGVQFEASAAGDRSCYIELNGVDGAGTKLQPWSRTTAASGLETALNLSFPRHFDVDDFIALTVRQNTGSALNVENAVFWADLMVAD